MKELSIEEKELLLADLCARLPYGVVVFDTGNRHQGKLYKISDIDAYYISESNGNGLNDMLIYIKPYLRPMSSMTEEEKERYHELCDSYYGIYFDSINSIDWLNKKMFAYRTIDGKDMFELGLAFVAPEGMYKL